jgi:lipopolysaccharide biosynthesis glycosyltransferase
MDSGECIIYAIGTKSYIDLCVFSMITVINKGKYKGKFLINYCEKIKDLVMARKEFQSGNCILNPVSMNELKDDSMFFMRYFIPSCVDYRNFLYIDTDIIAKKDINPILDEIKSNEVEVFCVNEIDKIKKDDLYHAYSNNGEFVETALPGLNSGTFGFSLKNKDLLLGIPKMEKGCYALENSKSDQPAFNKTIHEKAKFNTSLRKFVCLNPAREAVNESTILIHFAGDAGLAERKLYLMRRAYGLYC